MPLNVKLFNKIIKHIDADVRRLWMPTWGVKKGTVGARDSKGDGLRGFAPCDTACCFGGWSHILRHRAKPRFDEDGTLIMDVMAEVRALGLNELEGNLLFSSVAGTRKQQWKVVKNKIRAIIAERVASGEQSAARIKVPK